MISNKKTLSFICGSLAVLISPICFGQTKPKSASISLERTIEVDSQQAGKTENIDLGEIEIAQPHTLTLRLMNAGQQPFRFGKIEGNCSCMSIRVKEGEIESGKHIDIGVDFSAPERSGGNFLITLSFFENEKSSIPFYEIQAKARLKGVLRFGMHNRLIELEQQKISTIRIPLETSDPVKPEKLEIKTSESLKDFAAKTVTIEGKPFVSLEVPDAGIPEDYLSGWVEVKDVPSGRKDKADLLFSKFKPFRISPQISRLTEIKEENKDSKNEASGFLRIELPQILDATTENERPAEEMLVSAKATIDKAPIEVNLKKVSSTIYRWNLVVDKNFIDGKGEGEIEWDIQIGKQDFKFQTLWSKSK